MSSAWIDQDDKQVKKHGEEKAGWYIGWIDPFAVGGFASRELLLYSGCFLR